MVEAASGMTIPRPGLLGRVGDPAVGGRVVRALGVAALVAIVGWVVASGSVAGDDELLVAASLVVLSAAWRAFLLPARLDQRLQVAALLVVGACAAVLNHLRPVTRRSWPPCWPWPGRRAGCRWAGRWG